MGKKSPQLKAEPIPRSTWNINVRTMLPPECWRKIREITFEAYGCQCYFCLTDGSLSTLHCHEIWRYNDDERKQRLSGVVPVCEACHDVLHIGRSFAINKGHEALKHLARVNGWTSERAFSHIKRARDKWVRRSTHKWAVDISHAHQLLKKHGVSPSAAPRKPANTKVSSSSQTPADCYVSLDFETSGLSPQYGDVVIEVGAVKIENGEITGRFQQLINPGFEIDAFIEQYTGITNEMLAKGDRAWIVFGNFMDFVGDMDIVAHNASFEQRFLKHELEKLDRSIFGKFLCTVKLGRRIIPGLPTYALGALLDELQLSTSDRLHRALADAEGAHRLYQYMLGRLRALYPDSEITIDHMASIMALSPAQIRKNPGMLNKVFTRK